MGTRQYLNTNASKLAYGLYFIFSVSAIAEWKEKVISSPDVSKKIFFLLLIVFLIGLFITYTIRDKNEQEQIRAKTSKTIMPWFVPLVLLCLYIISALLYQYIGWLIWIQLIISLAVHGWYDYQRKKSTDKISNE